MNKVIAVLIGLVLGAVFAHFVLKQTGPLGAGGGTNNQFYYYTATHATTSVTTNTNWTTILAKDDSRGYVAICHTGAAISNDAIFLGFGATTTKPYGYRLGQGECYEMKAENMFFGAIYGIASTATSTVLTTVGQY